MNYWWHQLGQLQQCAGSPEGFVVIVSMGTLGGLITAVILIAIRVVWSIPQIWREVLAEERAKRPAKQGGRRGSSHLPPPASDFAPIGDVPPTSDI